jgi:hypothetical protein
MISALALASAIVMALGGCGGSGQDGGTGASAGQTLATASANPGNGNSSAGPAVTVLSSKPEYVTGGSALIDVAFPSAAAGKARALKITLNGADITASFSGAGGSAHLQAVVKDLKVGDNTIVASVGNASSTLRLTNYPITGPVFSGPWQTPYICQTQDFVLPDGSRLGPPLDANCSVATKLNYLYASTAGGALKPMTDLKALPADVARTTTMDGRNVPFVVRVETGTVDRGIYQNAVLHDPTKEAQPTPFAPPKAWNRRLIAIEGFGCPAGWYIQGAAQGNIAVAGFDFSLLNLKRLGEGYAMFANTLHHASNNCNAVLASEAAMMSKEAVIKTFGVPDFTVSAGCSGGSYGSAQPADRLPDLFDGILISCTFPDPLSIAFSGSDGHLITHFITQYPSAFTDEQVAALTGYKSKVAFVAAANQAGRTDPVPGRVDYPGYVSGVFNAAVPAGLRYDPVSNPNGVRPTVYDASKNIYGIDRTTGFALRPFDNVGVQYGLQALNAGAITAAQFLDLNEKIGGYDQDANYTAARVAGDAGAILRAQQSALQTGGNGGLASIPVFDVSGIYNDDNGYHYQWFHFALRERMLQANGDTQNHVMWRGTVIPADTAWDIFIKWVAAYKADQSAATQRQKVIAAKPGTAVDGCWRNETDFIAEPQTLSSTGNTSCNQLYPSWVAPRIVAGGPVAANVIKCALKPVDPADYTVMLSPAELARLRQTFPGGVCDWTKPGPNQTGVVPYGSFGPSPVNLLFDITRT